MFAVIFAIIAGAAMSFQGVFNTRLSDHIGLYESNVLVQGIAFLCSVIVLIFFGTGNFSAVHEASKMDLLGGALGVVITVTVMLAMKGLGATIAVSIILIAQLLTAAVVDAFGLLNEEKIPFTWQKILGLILMVGGVMLLKYKLPT
ncbi:MAG: DMT family transporter [Oscillospiraceae bacterium]|jgi:transporter family-2 protein|nr:DMT family transporter [Ruminococcaceae bacterium BL-4]